MRLYLWLQYFIILFVLCSLFDRINICYGAKVSRNFQDNASWSRCWSQVCSFSLSVYLIVTIFFGVVKSMSYCTSWFNQHCTYVLLYQLVQLALYLQLKSIIWENGSSFLMLDAQLNLNSELFLMLVFIWNLKMDPIEFRI